MNASILVKSPSYLVLSVLVRGDCFVASEAREVMERVTGNESHKILSFYESMKSDLFFFISCDFCLIFITYSLVY